MCTKQLKRRIEGLSLPEEPAERIRSIVQTIYRLRGALAQGAERVDCSLAGLLHYSLLPDIEQAASILCLAIQQRKKLLVVGDFDVDGATGTALAVRALRALGADSVDYMVPNRFTEGYGLSAVIVDRAHDLDAEILITVDHGISSHAAVAYAKALGMQVIVTDHHLPLETLPVADAVVNPCRTDSLFPSACLAGVGVVFYLLCAVRNRLIREGRLLEATAPKMREFLDLVALGTIADMVPLDENNRRLVQYGLKALGSSGVSAVGMKALLQAAGREESVVDARLVGFVLAPRLNAAGRLADMSVGVRLLLSDQAEEATQLAQQLQQYNQERQAIEASMSEEVEHCWLAGTDAEGEVVSSLVYYHDQWHEGVVGLLANRLVAKTGAPAIALAPSRGDPAIWKGSGRSVVGVDLQCIMAEFDRNHPGVLRQFGGHAMAIGIALPRTELSFFQRTLSAALSACMRTQTCAAKAAEIWSDLSLEERDCDLRLARAIRAAGPWGVGFQEPTFDSCFRLIKYQCIRNRHLKLWLQSTATGEFYDGIWFDGNRNGCANNLGNIIHIAYQLTVHTFRGREQVQLLVVGMWDPRKAMAERSQTWLAEEESL